MKKVLAKIFLIITLISIILLIYGTLKGMTIFLLVLVILSVSILYTIHLIMLKPFKNK